MIEIFNDTVHVDYGQAYVAFGADFSGDMAASFVGQENGLCGAAVPGLLFLTTALHTGPVGLTIVLHEAEPALDPAAEEIVEVSLMVGDAPVSLLEWAAEAGTPLALPPGTWRLRCSGAGMDEASERDTNLETEPVDTYRLDLWPAPAAPDAVIRSTTEIGAYWHDWSKGL